MTTTHASPAPPPGARPGSGTYRDEWGIPHLWAESADDLARLQGMNAASDRSWQIELERWRSEGRTAEMMGPSGLAWDRFARQARLDDTARRCFDALDGPTRRWCASYVEGINQALASGVRGGPEFERSGTSPAPWNPWTPLGVFLVQHILFSTFPNKLFRAHVSRTLGPGAVDLFSIEAPVWSGSNAWAVHGSEAAGGSPLIAGDPHRLLELPGVYQQVRLACPEFDVVGLAFPGVPGLPHFGHAGTAAWAITNAMADYQDLFEEELRRTSTGMEARGPGGWEPAAAHVESIKVRGGSAQDVEIVVTARGPVIVGGPDGGALSLRIPAQAEGRLGFEALLPLLRCRSVDDIEAAMRHWVEPVNSVVAADTNGAVRHFLAGLVPQRNHANRVAPVPASSAEHAWCGSYVKLPQSGVDSFAVSANDREAGGGDATGMEFAPAHRARRIRELLQSAEGGSLTVEHMRAIQQDTLLGPLPLFHRLLESLDAADPATSPLSPAARQLRGRILGWDGRMDAGSADAGAFATWRAALVRRIARHPALKPLQEPSGHSPLFNPWLSVPSRIGFALETILARGPELGINPSAETAAALEDAAQELTALEHAAGAPSAVWGTRHTLLPVHELADGLAAIPETALSGDTGCVLSTESLPGVEDRSFRGPVARYVWDMADRQNSRWVVPFGASGNPSSPHFSDQLPLWAAGELIPVVTDWHLLTKEPPATMPRKAPDFGRRTVVHVEELQTGEGLSIVPLDPDEDLDLIHGWVTQERARFWGMLEHSREDVLEIYQFLDSLETHHAFLVLLDGRPQALFQTYEPLHDPIGEAYAAREADIGMHLLLAPTTTPVPDFTPRLVSALIRYMFSLPGKDRIVVEPDARNGRAVRRLESTCFELGPTIQLAEKEAQFAYLTQERFNRTELLRTRSRGTRA